MRFPRFISRRIENYKKRTMDGMNLLFESAFKGGMFGLIVATIVWSSIFLYVVFYYMYMPSLSHTRPVYLQFNACENEKGVCSFPSAHVQLTKRQQLLMIGQKYKIFLNLDMPESPANLNLGMFMVCARMVDRNGILISNSCRSSMLHYQSQLLRLILTLVNLPFFIFGSREEKQTIMIELYTDFEEHQSHPVTDIYVEIQSRFIEVYSATMHIQAHLSGLRYLMFQWPILSTILGVASNLFVIAFIFSLSWYHLYIQNEQGRTVFIDFIKESLTGKMFRRRRVTRNQAYVEELSPRLEKQSGSSSESDDSKSGFFKPATSEELGSYITWDGDD